MKLLILEDEPLAAERIKFILKNINPEFQVLDVLESIEEGVSWFKRNSNPDLILMDIHLSDGSCFDLLERINITAPIIFTTAYEEYSLDAHKYMSIDYILKPVKESDLKISIGKLFTMRDHFSAFNAQNQKSKTVRTRFLAKIGNRSHTIPVHDIAFFMAEDKLVFLFDTSGKRYTVNMTMEKIERELDANQFFRINRKYIINCNEVGQIKPYINNRIQIIPKGNHTKEPLIVSREKVSLFKKWADGMLELAEP